MTWYLAKHRDNSPLQGEMKKAYKILAEKREWKRPLERLGVHVSRMDLKEMIGRVWTGFI
jgi:hypothetical protein